jgi:predicted lipoprotein with Yx(FWY)xxD motif
MQAETATTSRNPSPSPGRHRHWTPSRRAILLGLVPAAAIAAACGSSSTTSSTSTTKAPTSTTGGSPAAVQTANSSKFGTILVDSQGRTLYTLTNNNAAVPCAGACQTVWPPALLLAGQQPAGSGVSNVSTASGSSGQQVTYKGLPLYRFSGDVTSGATNGDGINSFGGIWHVVKTSGGNSSTGAPSGGTGTTGGSGNTTTTSGGSSGGGY